jgi:hypothetical protein
MKWLITLLFASLIFSTTAANANGSLVLNPQRTYAYGWAISRVSQSVADSEAILRCSGSCGVVHHFSHTCAAYAADLTPHASANGWAQNRSLADAESMALHECRAQGGTRCIVLAWGCDR